MNPLIKIILIHFFGKGLAMFFIFLIFDLLREKETNSTSNLIAATTIALFFTGETIYRLKKK